MKTIVAFALVATATLAKAQLIVSSNGTLQCIKPGGSYCLGDSLTTDLIVKCDDKGLPQQSLCCDSMAGKFPFGSSGSACYQTSPTSGDAACEKNCIVYRGSDTSMLPHDKCTPSATFTPPVATSPCPTGIATAPGVPGMPTMTVSHPPNETPAVPGEPGAPNSGVPGQPTDTPPNPSAQPPVSPEEPGVPTVAAPGEPAVTSPVTPGQPPISPAEPGVPTPGAPGEPTMNPPVSPEEPGLPGEPISAPGVPGESAVDTPVLPTAPTSVNVPGSPTDAATITTDAPSGTPTSPGSAPPLVPVAAATVVERSGIFMVVAGLAAVFLL